MILQEATAEVSRHFASPVLTAVILCRTLGISNRRACAISLTPSNSEIKSLMKDVSSIELIRHKKRMGLLEAKREHQANLVAVLFKTNAANRTQKRLESRKCAKKWQDFSLIRSTWRRKLRSSSANYRIVLTIHADRPSMSSTSGVWTG